MSDLPRVTAETAKSITLAILDKGPLIAMDWLKAMDVENPELANHSAVLGK